MTDKTDDIAVLLRRAAFWRGAVLPEHFPPDEGAEVAFAGRSNAGKSRALNALTQHTNLARVSKTPGRTQQINFFTLDASRRLVDLPGYGYAKVNLRTRSQWQQSIGAYLEIRHCLRGLIVLMDIRHPYKDSDLQLLRWCATAQLPCHIALTKSDKLSRSVAITTLKKAQTELTQIHPGATAQTLSSLTGEGVDTLRTQIAQWLWSAQEE